MVIGVASRPRRSELILARPGESALILLNPHTGAYYTLDEVGSRVWDLCTGQATIAEIVAIIGEEYDAPASEIAADVRDLLEELASEQLVLDAV